MLRLRFQTIGTSLQSKHPPVDAASVPRRRPMRPVLNDEDIAMLTTIQRLAPVRARRGLRALGLASAWLLLGAMTFELATAQSQQAAAILAPGDGVVTGFSGIAPSPGPLPKGANPLDQFLIDPEGPSLQIMQLGAAGGPPQGQLIPAPATFKVKAGDIGQVFAIAFDDAAQPNIYVTASSAYGLHIVGPDGQRLRQGKAGAKWMPGQF